MEDSILESCFFFSSSFFLFFYFFYFFIIIFYNLDKTMMADNLQKQSLEVFDWCFKCKSSTELVEHLLLHCLVAWDIGNLYLLNSR